jgi:hypothetical protein
MFKKNLTALFVMFSVFFIFDSAVSSQAEETQEAAESKLLQVMLPASAQRVLPGSVPAEITQTLEKVTAAGNGKFRQGETEVLLWTGAGYKKANAAEIVNRLTGTLKNSGWQYAVEGEEGGVTVFTALQSSPRQRAVIGFYGATDKALILAAMEILPNGSAATATNVNQTESDVSTEQVERPANRQNPAGGGSIIGTWGNGYSSILAGYTPTVGPKSYTPGRNHRFEYVFHPNGTFEFTGLMQITVYSCTTTYFQDKRGRYTINGDQLTLTLTKNLWRKQESCAPSSNKEINHKLDPETYTLSVSRNDRGKEQICLSSGGNTPCYEHEQK